MRWIGSLGCPNGVNRSAHSPNRGEQAITVVIALCLFWAPQNLRRHRCTYPRTNAGQSVSTPDENSSYASTLGPHAQTPHRTYIDSGYYADQLERYLQLFPREQLHVVVFDDLVARSVETMERLYHFLGVDPA